MTILNFHHNLYRMSNESKGSSPLNLIGCSFPRESLSVAYKFDQPPLQTQHIRAPQTTLISQSGHVKLAQPHNIH